jgi:hypothetical protein
MVNSAVLMLDPPHTIIILLVTRRFWIMIHMYTTGHLSAQLSSSSAVSLLDDGEVVGPYGLRERVPDECQGCN